MNNNYKLYDEDFLIALSEQQNREIYAKITSLDINELPQDYIEGKITTGSINIDGNSSVRRTCNLTMVSDNKELKDFYWGIKTKFQLEIGLRNHLYGEYRAVEGGNYPNIVWFPQGIYLIATFNTSISTNSLTISISGKDKMSLLNGDFGGQLFASINFGEEELVDTGVEKVFFSSKPKNSGELINKNYYIKLTEDDFNELQDKGYNNIDFNNPNFKFSLAKDTDLNGLYYKSGNIYIQDLLREEPYKHYNIFVRIEKMLKDKESLVFKKVPNVVNWNYADIGENYKKYYYKENEVYILNTEESQYDKNKQYYRLNTNSNELPGTISKGDSNYDSVIPINIYQKNFYYCKPNSDPYYSLSSAVTAHNKEDIHSMTKDRDYYELSTSSLYETYENVKKRQIPIREIIKEAVHTYAKEPYQNIIIKDLDEYGLEQLTYKGDIPLYALYDVRVGQFTQIHILSDTETEDIFGESLMNLNTFIPDVKENDNLYEDKYKVMKIEYGQDVGYRLTDLTYAGELISKPGETLTSVFDKIKQMLGNFEYFYDLNGRFVFQKKPNYIQTTFSQIVKNEDESYINYENSNSKFSFNFEGNKLISSFQNNPTLNNVKNDYSIWGKRKTSSGAEKKIHLRYAIDKKPIYYKNLKNEIYITKEYQGDTDNKKVVDWRELIYQMALDYFAGQGWSEENQFIGENDQPITSPDYFLYEIGRRNPDYYPSGYTGYEQYYTDLQGFWRELYNPNPEPKPLYTDPSYALNSINRYVWIEPELYDYKVQYYFHKSDLDENDLLNEYSDYNVPENSEKFGWNINVFDHPESLDFWFDFLDSDFELAQFSVPQLGPRSKALEESDVSAIDYGQVPDLIFYTPDMTKTVSYESKEGAQTVEIEVCDEAKLAHEINENTGYTFILLPTGYSQFFDISSRKASLKDKLDELLYQNSYCIENITISAIPIYYLEPNTRIFVQDKETNIEGEYIINRLTIPLNYNGTMSIAANKAPQRIY